MSREERPARRGPRVRVSCFRGSTPVKRETAGARAKEGLGLGFLELGVVQTTTSAKRKRCPAACSVNCVLEEVYRHGLGHGEGKETLCETPSHLCVSRH